MKICFTTDLHGRAALYDQLEAVIIAETPGLLILGGDMFTDGEIDDPVGTQVAFAEQVFIPRVERWKQLCPGLTVACILGNHDWLCSERALRGHHEAGRIVLLEPGRPWRSNGMSYVGYYKTPPTPYWVKDFERLDLPGDAIPETGGAVWDDAAGRSHPTTPDEHFRQRPTLADELAEIAATAEPWIFVCHAPPHASRLDRLPHVEYPVGSRAVRRFIERRQPLVALHGHIHESPSVTGAFSEQIGRTLCVNPGQGAERLHAVLLDTSDPARTLRHTGW